MAMRETGETWKHEKGGRERHEDQREHKKEERE